MKNILFTVFVSFVCHTSLLAQNTEEHEAILTEAQKKDFRDQAQHVIGALADYVEIIGNKDAQMGSRKKSVDLAVKLFMTDSNVIEVSNAQNSDIKRIPVRTYFMKILWLPYEKVTITWYDVYLSPTFDLGKDGRYYGTATVHQKFVGVSSKEYGNGKYVDITEKKIQIIIEKIPAAPGGIESSWRLFLGDINVQETKQK